MLKNIAFTLPVAAVAGRILAQGAPAPKAAPGAKWLADSDATAKALGYVPDATKAERAKKADVEGKDQFCQNCQFFTKGDAIEGQEAGKCLMLPAGAVHAKGWCKSWMKKA